MFIHDPLTRDAATVELLRQAFGLDAGGSGRGERAALRPVARRLCAHRKISPNTVYTHIRRIKAKTGCTRMPELIRKLDDIQVTVVHKR